MRAGGGKQKGASFERHCCVTLSLWMSNGKSEDYYWRSAMSGGRATVAFAKGKRLSAQAGDISAVYFIGHELTDKFLIECKHYRDLGIASLLRGKGKLIEFWTDTKIAAKRHNKRPMLIAKQNNLPTFVGLGLVGLREFDLDSHCTLIASKHNLHVVTLDDFLTHAVKPRPS